MKNLDRRPIDTRSSLTIRRFAAWLASTPVTPNGISVCSLILAITAASALLYCPKPWGWIICAVGIQLRLLCNLLDGLVAVEGGRKTALGDLYNEIPDRISDVVLLLALGYAAELGWMGWLAALLALMTAYIRLLGGALGLAQDFRGPQSKSQRMALMTGACLLAWLAYALKTDWPILRYALQLITAGTALTCILRIRRMAKQLKYDAQRG